MREAVVMGHGVLSNIRGYHTADQAILQHVGLLYVDRPIPEDTVLVVLISSRVPHMEDMRLIDLRGYFRLVVVAVCGGSAHVSITFDDELVFEVLRAWVGFVFFPIFRYAIEFLFENVQQYLTHLPLLFV